MRGVAQVAVRRYPRLGAVLPITFIPSAEETGLIVQIGDWVLREARLQNKAWQDAGLPPMVVSVNVSARQFSEKTLVDRVANALKESGLEAKYLESEVTESLIMQDCRSARGSDADRRYKMLIPNGMSGSKVVPNNKLHEDAQGRGRLSQGLRDVR